MGEKGRKLCGLERSPDNSLMVACGDEVVVSATHNATTVDDVAAADDVVFADVVPNVVGAATTVDF